MKWTVARTAEGFAVSANGAVVDFAVGETSEHSEKFSLDRNLDAVRRQDGSFAWRPSATPKLRQLGLWTPYLASGAPQTKPLPDVRVFLTAAGIIEAAPNEPKPRAADPAPAPAAPKADPSSRWSVIPGNPDAVAKAIGAHVAQAAAADAAASWDDVIADLNAKTQGPKNAQ